MTPLTSSAVGELQSRSSAAASSSGSTGSTGAAGNAFGLDRASARTPRFAKRRRKAPTSRAGPRTTQCVPFSAASESPGPRARAFVFRISAATVPAGANTAARRPPAGSDASSAPRRTANRIPSSSPKPPAAQAAPISPAPWPSAASGATPAPRQSSVTAAASAKSAGCANEGPSRSPRGPSSPNIAGSSDAPPRSSRKTVSQRSSTSRAAGSHS